MSDEELLPVNEAARRLRLSTRELLRLVVSGEVEFVMVDGIAHIPVRVVEEFRTGLAGTLDHDTARTTPRTTIPADLDAQYYEPGWVWGYLDEAPDPDPIFPGALIIAGDPAEPILARVGRIVPDDSGNTIVHLEILAALEWIVDELERCGLIGRVRDGVMRVSVPADPNQIDENGWCWTFFDKVAEPGNVRPGRVVVAGDTEEPVIARVVDMPEVDGNQIVRMEILGVPEEVIDELRWCGLI